MLIQIYMIKYSSYIFITIFFCLFIATLQQ